MGILHPITRQGDQILSFLGGYPSDAKNLVQITPTTTNDYWAFGNGVITDSNTIVYLMKRGPDHLGGTGLGMAQYNMTTGAWTTASTIATTGTSDIYSGVAAGKIGSHLYCFVSKYNGGSDTFTASGYIKSTDLTGSSWGSYQSITAPPYERFESYGKFQESVTTPGKYFTTRFSHKSGGSDPWCLEIIKVTDDGATWTPIVVYDGAVKYSEMALVNVGGSNWIGLARKFETSGVFGLFRSTNDCENWTLVGEPNLGVGPGNGDLIYVDGLIHFLFQNRTTGYIQISKNNVLGSVLNLKFNAPVNYWNNAFGSVNGLGYPWWTYVRTPDIVYITGCKETSTTEAHVWGTLDRIANI